MRTETTTTAQAVSAWRFSATALNVTPLTLDDPKSFLRERYSGKFMFGLDDLKKSGMYRLMGWQYDFRPFLKRYLVKQYGSWYECYAPNRTLLRASTYGRIQEILTA